jgi:hypothetical protein
MKKYGKEWAIHDTVNATIGQGYVQVKPLQQAIIASRLASGKLLMPRLMHEDKPPTPSLGVPQEHLDFIHAAMHEMVNGRGTGHAAKIPIPGVEMAGKSGTAQVVGLNIGNGKGGLWRHRDHGHFICFAPFDKPRYACAVLVEHGGGSGAAMPIARDVMTYMFDQQKAWDALSKLEAGWGGTPQQRQAARYRSYAAQYGVRAPAVRIATKPWRVRARRTPAPPRSRCNRCRPARTRTTGRRCDRPCPRTGADTFEQRFDGGAPMNSNFIPTPLRGLPWRILIPLTALVLFGATVLWSAAGGNWSPYAWKHIFNFGLFLSLAIGISRLPEHTFRKAAYPIYGGLVFLLMLVEAVGKVGGGASAGSTSVS